MLLVFLAELLVSIILKHESQHIKYSKVAYRRNKSKVNTTG